MDFLRNKKALLIIGLAILGVGGVLFLGYQWLFGPGQPIAQPDVVLRDAGFAVTKIDTLHFKVSLEFIAPEQRQGEKVESQIGCGDDETVVMFKNALAPEEQQKLDKELEALAARAA